MKKSKWKHKLVYVEWADATQPTPQWEFFSEVEAGDPMPCKSVGWVHTYNKEMLLLYPSVAGMETEYPAGMGATSIPSSAVRSIAEIEVEV